ncbi:MAG: ABC-F family ATP-binding cassette domain-containing protein [Kofleriaceae bacterium]|nr:ABC-F family ATP-binding cassette domain-containing protein [Myxococcales bacterium]MCB9561830.1 ABC-F family ATP-binding cassette domain-containing protein [Kofleriaceae bacterium]MCB9574094.1 ABC-F family ATP-binding cassette domain-containing protein [Kofleriaceae bacterium]
MSLVVLEDVALFYADRIIFDGVSLRFGHGDHVGLIGPNGSGKTSLLRVIAGAQEIDDGKVVRAKGVRIGWLPQELVVEGGRSLLDFVRSSVPGRSELDAELEAAEADLAAATAGGDDAELLDGAARIAELHERIDHFERFFGDHEALSILAGLGFQPGEEQRDLGELSGGWKMRAVLAGLLFQRPEVLLLDEPTNHLDMPSVAWFGDFLKRWPRCFILISHDRDFLNEQISKVVSLEPEGVRQYPGNYERYLTQRAEEEQILAGQAKNLAREREHLQKFVDRFRAQANKARAVQSRVKQLEKMETVQTFEKRGVMRFTFPPVDRTVAEVVRIEHLRKAYGDHVVFPDLDLTVRRGEKIGIIGVNGAGKTTLLKMIAGELGVDGGTIRIGNGVKVGYYAQHHADTLDLEATVFDAVQRANMAAPASRVRQLLGAFLFSGDDVDKPCKVLSGGERARVALARLLVDPGSLMLMDEPTNHLDLDSAESLAKSLTTYEGTLIFVSHNRNLVRTLATRIWNVEAGGVEEYPGTLDEYLYSCAQRRREVVVAGGPSIAAGVAAAAAAPEARASREDDKARKRREAELRNRRHKTLGPLEKKVAQLEERIAELETAQATRSAALSDPEVYADDARRRTLLGEFTSAQEKLDELTGRWEAAAQELESARERLDAEEAAS